MKGRLAWLPILAALALAPAAGAETTEVQATDAQAGAEAPLRHMGAPQEIGDYVGELELTGAALTLRVSDAKHRPADTAEMSATVIAVAKDGRKNSVALKPAGENRLAGTIKFEPPEHGMRAIVMLSAGPVEVGRAIYNLTAAH